MHRHIVLDYYLLAAHRLRDSGERMAHYYDDANLHPSLVSTEPQSQFERHNAVDLQTNHRETDRTIARTFIRAFHLFETMIHRFTI